MSEKPTTIDFGAPDDVWRASVSRRDPGGRTEPVVIVEDYGYRGQEGGIPRDEERVVLKRPIWSAIADIARREFNDRLKAAKVLTGRWHTGTNLVDRLLGKELCVLAWAAETANEEQIPVICSKWAALRPEERWWLFSMTVAEAGLPEDTNAAGGAPCSTRFRTARSPRQDASAADPVEHGSLSAAAVQRIAE